MTEPITEYDKKGNVTHFKEISGYERWAEYDDKGNETYYKSSNGYERWTEYDERGNKIHYKNSDGLEYWNEFNKDGKYKCSLIIYTDGKISTENEKQFSDKLRKKYNLLLLRGRR